MSRLDTYENAFEDVNRMERWQGMRMTDNQEQGNQNISGKKIELVNIIAGRPLPSIFSFRYPIV
jgi:hypothetical protein